MIERDSPIPVKRQAQLLDLSRSSIYYVARCLPERDLQLMRILDELHLKWPFYGARKLTRELQNQGHEVGRRHVTTLMRGYGWCRVIYFPGYQAWKAYGNWFTERICGPACRCGGN